MLRSRMVRVGLVAAGATLLLAVPAVLMAQRAPRITQVDVARLPAVQQSGTIDVRGETLPLYRGGDAVRASIGSRGGVLRLSSHDLRVVLPAGASRDSTVGVQMYEGWPSKISLTPMRRVGPALKLVGELGGASSPVLFDMRLPDLDAQPGHRLVLVGVHAPEADQRAFKVEISGVAAGQAHANKSTPDLMLKARAGEARAGARAHKIRTARAQEARTARAHEIRTARARTTSPRAAPRLLPARAYEVWEGTLDGQRVTVVSAFYDPRSDRLTADFDGGGSFQAFAFGWIAEDVLLSGTFRKRPGRTKALEGRMIRATPRR